MCKFALGSDRKSLAFSDGYLANIGMRTIWVQLAENLAPRGLGAKRALLERKKRGKLPMRHLLGVSLVGCVRTADKRFKIC